MTKTVRAKIRKAVIIDRFLKKSLDHTQPGDSALVTPEGSLGISAPADMDADRYNSDYRSIGSFSLSKDINKVHSIQLFCKEFFEKSKEKAQADEERTWGGKVYVKTVNCWWLKRKGINLLSPQEAKIRKAVIIDRFLKKSLDHTYPGDSALVTPEGSLDISAPAGMDAARFNTGFRSIGSFSLSKDINKVHSIQLFCKEFFEKVKKRYEV